MAQSPVRKELNTITTLLEGELSNKERFALLVARQSIEWFLRLGTPDALPAPSESIMGKSVDSQV